MSLKTLLGNISDILSMVTGYIYYVINILRFYRNDAAIAYNQIKLLSNEYIVTAQTQPQPKSTTTQVVIDHLMGWTTQPTHETLYCCSAAGQLNK